MTLHISYNRDLYRKMHRQRSGEPPLTPKVPKWVLALKELGSLRKRRPEPFSNNKNSPQAGSRTLRSVADFYGISGCRGRGHHHSATLPSL